MATDTPAEGYADEGEARSLGRYWHDQIEQAEKLFKPRFWETGAKIVRRYRDERDAVENRKRRFNILWSNVQVLKPALYGRAAKPDVQRRHNDNDPVGRTAALMLERTLSYEVENFTDFDAAMSGAVEDRLLPGRGVSWVRYEPNIVQMPPEEAAQQAPAPQGEDVQVTEDVQAPPGERVQSARSPTDYVYWQDFLHNPARTWEEVWWTSRCVYMTKKEGRARFGEIFDAVPIAYDATESTTTKKPKLDHSDKKAKVYEVWNKRTGKVCWVAKGYPHHLDEKPDPLQLEGFFPCPRPLNATTTTDNVLPVADYCEYQDQAEELDTLTQRISLLTKACKVVGVFNAEHKALLRIFNEGVDNTMIPVDSWAAFAEKGGLKGEVVFLDLSTIIATLAQLYESRESVKQTIYEVMGISDVIRGATNPNETLGAQQLKANFGSSRIKSSQTDVARYASDLFKLKAQIVAKFYPPELIVEMSGIAQTPDGQDQAVVQQAVQLLKNSTSRDWRISVEADSLAQLDEQQDKAERVEFVTMLGTALKEAGPIVGAAPELAPLVFESIKFAARGFKVGKSFESIIDQAQRALMQRTQAGGQQDPKAMQEQAMQQAKAQVAQENATKEIGLNTRAADLDIREMKFGAEQQVAKVVREAEDAKRAAAAQAEEGSAKMRQEQASVDEGRAKYANDMANRAERDNAGRDEMLQSLVREVAKQNSETQAALASLVKAMSAPKRIKRGLDGRVESVEVIG